MSTAAFPTSFDSLADLARLPWFSLDEHTRLVVDEEARSEVGPVIDAHTHLAMGFLRRLRVDLRRPTARTAMMCALPRSSRSTIAWCAASAGASSGAGSPRRPANRGMPAGSVAAITAAAAAL